MLVIEEKNQTHPDWIDRVRTMKAAEGQPTSGTGLFALPNPAEGPDQIQTIIVPNLTFPECAKRGADCLAFKWVPEVVATFANVKEEISKNASCDNLPCQRHSHCKTYHCWCVQWYCRK